MFHHLHQHSLLKILYGLSIYLIYHSNRQTILFYPTDYEPIEVFPLAHYQELLSLLQ